MAKVSEKFQKDSKISKVSEGSFPLYNKELLPGPACVPSYYKEIQVNQCYLMRKYDSW